MGNKTGAGIRVFHYFCQHGPDCEEGLPLQKAESLLQVCCKMATFQPCPRWSLLLFTFPNSCLDGPKVR